MAKKISVLDFLSNIGAASDKIPVKVKEGAQTVCCAPSLNWLESHGMPGVLEAKVNFVDICRDGITIYVKTKDYTTKI